MTGQPPTLFRQLVATITTYSRDSFERSMTRRDTKELHDTKAPPAGDHLFSAERL
jgi:hypothetical protein